MQLKPVICGVDIGSWTFKVCAYDGSKFEILTNEANFRETPSLVSFTPSQRLIGEEALNKLKSNFQNTIRAPLRLIGLERSFDLVEQELKNATARYEIDEQLFFTIKHEKEKAYTVQPQQLLIALLGKVRNIIQSHRFQIEHLYIPIPSYLSHYERKIIKRCAETAHLGKSVKLVDDWICIASEYSFSRLKQIKTGDPRAVVFVDIGYSKLSIFIMEFNQKDVKLLDCEHMRFTGSKHMDHLLAEFYDGVFKNTRHQETSIFSMPKSYIKLMDNIEKQRTVLSANVQHQINVESLIQDHDLVYHMKRQELQKIVNPVITEIKTALTNLKNRMPPYFKLHSIELLGGTSRMPFIKQLITRIFVIEPSKTLNQSQAMASGATIYGSIDSQSLSFDYTIQNMNLTDICVGWNNSGNKKFFGEDDLQYSKKKLIFAGNSAVPDQSLMSFGNEGPIEMYIYYGQNVSTKSIGYLRFQTPNRVKFTLDSNKIVDVQLENSQPDILKLYDKKQSRWEEMRKWETQLQLHEARVRQIYELKNLYETKLYQLKSKREEYRDFMSQAETLDLNQQLMSIEKWIESEHDRTVGSQQDYLMYTQKLQEITSYLQLFELLQIRKNNSYHLLKKSQQLIDKIYKLVNEGYTMSKRRKLQNLLQWLTESQIKMRESQWQGYWLTDSSLNFAEEQIARIISS